MGDGRHPLASVIGEFSSQNKAVEDEFYREGDIVEVAPTIFLNPADGNCAGFCDRSDSHGVLGAKVGCVLFHFTANKAIMGEGTDVFVCSWEPSVDGEGLGHIGDVTRLTGRDPTGYIRCDKRGRILKLKW